MDEGVLFHGGLGFSGHGSLILVYGVWTGKEGDGERLFQMTLMRQGNWCFGGDETGGRAETGSTTPLVMGPNVVTGEWGREYSVHTRLIVTQVANGGRRREGVGKVEGIVVCVVWQARRERSVL